MNDHEGPGVSQQNVPPTTPEPEQPRKGWFEKDKLFTGVVCLVLGALLTAGVDMWRNRMRYLPYATTPSPSLFKMPDLADKRIEVTVGGTVVENLSTVRLLVYNTTGSNWENVDVHVDFRYENGSPIKLVQPRIRTDPAAFKEIGTVARPNGGLRLSYQMPVINRSNTPIFWAEYTFDGIDSPITDVFVQKVGLGAEKRELEEITQAPQWMRVTVTAGLVVFFAVCAVSIAGIVGKLVIWWRGRKETACRVDPA